MKALKALKASKASPDNRSTDRRSGRNEITRTRSSVFIIIIIIIIFFFLYLFVSLWASFYIINIIYKFVLRWQLTPISRASLIHWRHLAFIIASSTFT